jgi:glycosyltransferase involved in cell wall biosynthesis
MKILMILNSTFPRPLDIRVIKESNSLIEAGYDVTLLCIRDPGEPEDDVYNGLKIKRIRAGASQYQLAFWDVVMSLWFSHPVFGSAIRKILRKEKIDAIHVHDLPLAGTALKIKNSHNIKVVVDLHENYADALRIWFKWKSNPIARLKNYLFLKPERWERYEGIAVRNADAVLTVVDEMKDRVVRNHQVHPQKITVISNTETKKFAEQQILPEVYEGFRGKFIIAYTGGIGPHRGVDTVIEAMELLKHQPEIIFVVIGTGSPEVMAKLNAQIQTLQLEKQVFLLGHKPFTQVYSYMVQASVNVIPHKSNPQNEHGVPHKLFQSMMAGKPVLVSSCAPLLRIVSETESGLIFKADDAGDCADKILALYNDPAMCKKLGANGFKASTGNYSWETTASKLIKLYSSLGSQDSK